MTIEFPNLSNRFDAEAFMSEYNSFFVVSNTGEKK